MTTASYVAADSVTMFRRNLLHMVRYPALTVFVVVVPVVLLLLLVFVFGGTLGAGLPSVNDAGGTAAYLAYVVPGILIATLVGGAQGTSTTVAMDMTEGIVARFRTMAISRAAVLAGHVIGNTVQVLIGASAVLVVALLIGYRPPASPVAWLGVLGFVALVAVALTWVAVAMGMASKSVESASNLPLILILLPLLGSGFVPTASMPDALRVFAEYQPFTPIIETLRALLDGTDPGSTALVAIAWCVAIAAGGYVWSLYLYNRRSVRG